ncbi:MAG: DUF1829 domain-containing protein [Helicobacteraceae bacterium]|nr:DUF1829 domain-containing protein [Helicobacteraceae bacterium]
MNTTDLEGLINNYLRWLKDKTVIKRLESDYMEITTPYLDRHNDCLQLYVRKNGAEYELTDDGYIITDLISSGCSLDSPKRKNLLNVTLAGFGIKRNGDALCVKATADNFPARKHNIIQAMLAVNDLFYMAAPYVDVESLFFEDVTKWLDLSEVRYTPRVKFMGKSGFDHFFDFVIPKSRTRGERVVQTLSNPKKDSAEALLFRWQDTRETRNNESQLFVIMNDADKSIADNVTDAFDNYQVKHRTWSKRQTWIMELAA